MRVTNQNLHTAKNVKNDEFYTRMLEVENEMPHYYDFLKGKIVLCNCDDFRVSNFYKYFVDNFDSIGLKKVICIGYKEDGHGIISIYDGKN